MNTKTENKRFQAGGFASAMVLCVSVFLCLIVTIQVLSRGYATVAGYSAFRVVTGSMEPTIPVGALVISHKTDINEVSVGDVVVFRAKVTAGEEKIITHRVVSRSTTGVNVLLETRGDANPVSDGTLIGSDALIGRVVWYSAKKDGVASVIGFLSNKTGFLACIVFPILVIGGLVLRESIQSIRRQLDEAVCELEQVEADREDQEKPVMTSEEYEELREKIKAELMKELMQSAAGTEEKTEFGSR